MSEPSRDITRTYTAKQFVSKLRRLADAIDNDERFRIQVGGERISVPPDRTRMSISDQGGRPPPRMTVARATRSFDNATASKPSEAA